MIFSSWGTREIQKILNQDDLHVESEPREKDGLRQRRIPLLRRRNPKGEKVLFHSSTSMAPEVEDCNVVNESRYGGTNANNV